MDLLSGGVSLLGVHRVERDQRRIEKIEIRIDAFSLRESFMENFYRD